jgi:hypothetical protein
VTILTYYTTPTRWPSVSIDRMVEWRGLSRTKVEKTVWHLEELGYLTRPGKDPRHGYSFFFDLSGLLKRLASLAVAEAEMARVSKERAEIRQRAVFAVSTEDEANRERKQSTETVEVIKKSVVEEVIGKSVVEDAKSVLVQEEGNRKVVRPDLLTPTPETGNPKTPIHDGLSAVDRTA